MILVALEPGVVYPCHARVAVEELGHRLRVGAVLPHAQVQRLQPDVEQERVHRRRYGAEVAHELCHELGGIGHLSEGFGVDKSVVRLVGAAQPRVAVGVGHPVEASAVYHTSAHLRGVAVHILGR